MHIHLIDDDRYFHVDAAIKLKHVGFTDMLSCYYSADEFFRKTHGMDLTNDVIVVDFELGNHTAVELEIADHVKRFTHRKLVLCSLLPSFGSDTEYINRNYDVVIRKDKICWKQLISFFSQPEL